MKPWDYITWSEMLFDLAICFYNHHWHLKAMQSPNQYMVLETYVDEKMRLHLYKQLILEIK